jgi:hypothetical protein
MKLIDPSPSLLYKCKLKKICGAKVFLDFYGVVS